MHKKLKTKQAKTKRILNHKQTSLSKFELLKILDSKSFYDLSVVEKKSIISTFGNLIEAYSFVPHPAILPKITSQGKLSRYIIIIETIRSDIYFKIRDFLANKRVNVSTYFTGGTADFICDGFFTDEIYKVFSNSLFDEFQKASAKATDKPEEFITIYRVEKEIIRCRKIINELPKPHADLINQLKNDLVPFEFVLSNYRSKECISYFGSEAKVNKYIKQLQEKNAVIGFNIVYDYGYGVERHYALLGQSLDPIKSILAQTNGSKALFLKPVSDLFNVVCINGADEADQKVQHISINTYSSPSERLLWRKYLYEYDRQSAVNLFYYPVEGTLNESPFVISDLQSVLSIAEQYNNGEVKIGYVSHRSLVTTNAPLVAFSRDALLFQGLTLGIPGSGKTTTDVVLASNCLEHVKSVIILDSSGSIRGKQEFLKKYSQKNSFRKIPHNITVKQLKSLLTEIITLKGLIVLEMEPADYCIVLKIFCQFIQRSDDNTKDGEPRDIKHFLLLEELHTAFIAGKGGTNKAEVIDQLINCLSMASRKGWCIWASTQFPSSLGYDLDSTKKILQFLNNKIIHHLDSETEIDILLSTLSGISDSDKSYIRSNVLNPLPHSAVVLGSEIQNINLCKHLSPILVKIMNPNQL